MSWFNKTEKKKEEPSLPEIPQLPALPEIPILEKENSPRQISQLPSFPNNSLGDKFSQNTIKEAVTGKKEGDKVFDDEALLEDNEKRMIQKPLLKKPKRKEGQPPILKRSLPPLKRKIKESFEDEKIERVKKEEPVFIRIDKFEESLKVFEKIKDQILEVERILKHTQKIKEEEEKELEEWENKTLAIKEQIEKVDRDIFSKVD